MALVKHILRAVLLAGAVSAAQAADPLLAPGAPKDKPSPIASMERFERAIAPHVRTARATYPGARARFLAGLPAGQSFFITTRLHDAAGGMEQVFIAVQSIQAGEVTGRIWSDVLHVKGYRNGQVYKFREDDMIDWMISKPDGSEEGNEVGKFLDTYDGR